MTLHAPPLDQSYRYWAFISYSHADERWARWLHRALEGYRIPRDLVGTTGRFGPFPDRLFPIFRDREELASSSSLPAQLREALARARVLVVICSPRAAQSRWVSEEIRAFKALGRENEVFCVIVDGEPYASSGARSVDECLPEPIRRRVDHDGRLLDEPAEPLAADARPTGDGKNGVVVKLVAGILGVGLDVLRRRDEQRRRRRTRGWAAVGLATIAALSLGIWYTNERRIEAEEATRRADVAARAESEARKAEELARIDAEDKRALAERREREAREARLAEEQQKREAIKQRDLAEERRTIALARQLAAQSTTVLNQFPDRLPLAVLLALESTRLHPSFESNQALRAGLTLLPLAIQRYAYSGPDPVRGRIRGLTFSPDRKYLAVARDDGTAEVLNLLQGTVAILHHQENPGAVVNLPGGGFQWKAPGVDAEVTSLAFSPDGQLLATGNNDRTARLWDMASGREIRRLQHGAAVSSVAFHPAGTYLATGSKEGKARIFDAGTGQPALEIRHEREVRIHEFKLEPGAGVAEQVVESKQVEEVRQVAFSPDGRYLAAISTDGRVSLLSLETKQLHRAWYAGAAGLGLAFSRDGKKLATANGDFAFVWEVETGKQLLKATHGPSAEEAVGHNVWVDTVAVSTDGNYLATGGRDGTARVWNLSSGQEWVRLKHGSTVETVAFGVDGTTLTTGSYHGARLWEIPSGRERLRAAGANEVVVFSPDGARVASGGGDGDISVWNLGRGDQLAQMAHSGAVRTMSFSPDGSKLATADDKGRVRLWSSAGELKAELKQPAFGTTRLVFSHDGRFLAAGARNPYLFIMNVEQDLAATSLATFRDAGDYVLSPSYVAAEGRDHRHVRIWETSGGRELTQIEALDLSAIKFDSTGTFLGIRQMDARGRSGTIRIWDLAHARESGRLAIKDRGEFAVAPRGQFLTLSASEPGEKKFSVNHYADVWDVSTARRVSRIPQDDTVAFIAFDPSGKRLLTIAGNFRNQQREVRVWELPTGKLKARLTHEEEIDAIRFSSEPDTLATLSAGRVYVWNLATSELLSQVTEASHIRDLRFSPDGRHLLTGSADGTAALWLWKTEDLRAEACKRLARNLSAAEWQHYLGATKYQTSCPNVTVNERR